jgi:hypothetical protein
LKAEGRGQLDGGVPQNAGQINQELITPGLKAKIQRAVKEINRFRQQRLAQRGENKSLLENLVRIREQCGQFAAWVTIARIEQNQKSSLSPEDRMFLETQKQILRERGCSSDDELLQLAFNL